MKPIDPTLLSMIARSMRNADQVVMMIEYSDASGKVTVRTISPIRLLPDRKLQALCLGRQEPRTFKIESIVAAKLLDSSEVLMPVPVLEIDQ